MALYPPILQPSLPAMIYVKDGILTIPYTIPAYSSIPNKGITNVRIVNQITNKAVIVNDTINNSYPKDNTYYINAISPTGISVPMERLDDSVGEKEGYYKVQIRFGETITTNQTQYSEWSTVMVIKFLISKPTLLVHGSFSDSNDINYEPKTMPEFVGIFEYTGEEYLDKYKFDLIYNEEVIETSNWLQHNLNYGNTGQNTYRFKTLLQNNQNYAVKYSIKTNNLYESNTTTYFEVHETTWEKNPNLIFLVVDGEKEDMCNEEGFIKIELIAEDLIGNYIVSRTDERSNYNIFEEVYRFVATGNDFIQTSQKNEDLRGSVLFVDYTIESGVKYKYIIQQENDVGNLRSTPIYAENNKNKFFMSNFQYSYLYSNNLQLKLKYNNKMSNLKKTLLISKQDTLGGKYPVVLRNGNVNYFEIPINALISLHLDDNSQFFQKKIDGYYYKNELIISQDRYSKAVITQYKDQKKDQDGNPIETIVVANENIDVFNTDLTEKNIYIERKFREKVIEFLTQNDVFLYKSPTEGNLIVSLTNINFTPNEQLGRAIYSFSSTAYEIMENSIENLINYGLWDNGFLTQSELQTIELPFVGQIQGVFQTGDDLVLQAKQKINNQILENGYSLELTNIYSYWIESFPQYNLDIEIQNIKGKLSNLQKEDGHEEEVLFYENELQRILKLKKTLSQEDLYPSYKLLKNNIPIIILPGKIYGAEEQLNSLVLSELNNSTIVERPLIFNFLYKARYKENQQEGIIGLSQRKAWGQLNGIFTDNKRDIFINANSFVQDNDGIIKTYDSLNLHQLIKNDVLNNLQYYFSDMYNYIYLGKDSLNDIEVYNFLSSNDSLISIRFETLIDLEIEGDAGTSFLINNKVYKIGTNERIKLTSVNLSSEEEILFQHNINAVVNYKYNIIRYVRKKGGIPNVDLAIL